MTAPNPQSKAGQLRAAEKTLRGLLRTPKTRSGLVAAVTGGRISRNFVYGWLAERGRDGTLTTLKSTAHVMYQIADRLVAEMPVQSGYPIWLDPRTLPISTNRAVHIDGILVQRKGTE